MVNVKVRTAKEGRSQGKRMASFALEDQTGSVRAVAFPETFARYEKVLSNGAAVFVTAALKANDGEHVELVVEEATPLEGIERRRATALRIDLDLTTYSNTEDLQRLHETMLHHEGKLPIRLRLITPSWSAELTPDRVLGVNPDTLLPVLTTLLGPGRTEYVLGANGG